MGVIKKSAVFLVSNMENDSPLLHRLISLKDWHFRFTDFRADWCMKVHAQIRRFRLKYHNTKIFD